MNITVRNRQARAVRCTIKHIINTLEYLTVRYGISPETACHRADFYQCKIIPSTCWYLSPSDDRERILERINAQHEKLERQQRNLSKYYEASDIKAIHHCRA